MNELLTGGPISRRYHTNSAVSSYIMDKNIFDLSRCSLQVKISEWNDEPWRIQETNPRHKQALTDSSQTSGFLQLNLITSI